MRKDRDSTILISYTCAPHVRRNVGIHLFDNILYNLRQAGGARWL